jgi:lysozyme
LRFDHRAAFGAPFSLPEGTIMTARTSAAGRKAISLREGNKLTAYRDSIGVLTIGVGHTSAAGEPHVSTGMRITAEQSDAILTNDLKDVEADINALVKVPVSQNQFDAIASFTFNVGGTNFRESTLLKKLNMRDYTGAADQFLVWTKAGGKPLQGLITRRKAERAQFLTPDAV